MGTGGCRSGGCAVGDDLPAGPELDRLVYQKVMGLSVEWTAAIGAWDPHEPLSSTIGRVYVVDPVSARLIPCPEYSTDIAHAWRVVEQMSVLAAENKCNAYWWNFTAGSFTDPCLGRTAFEDPGSVPLYICRAALLAVGENPDGL